MSLQAVKNRAARTAVDRVLRARARARSARVCLYIFIAGPEMATRNELQVNVSIKLVFEICMTGIFTGIWCEREPCIQD